MKRIVLGAGLVGYLLQIATAIYFAARPIAIRTLPGAAVTAALKKDVNPLSFVPLIGFVLLVRPENYHVVLSNGYAKKSFAIDIRNDLPLDDLKAISHRRETIVVRQSTGREIARLLSTNAGQ